MPKREFTLVNMDVLSEKRQLMSAIQVARGLWEVSMRQVKPKRSLDQNAYMHAAFVEPFRKWIQENWGEDVDHDQAYETLKLAVMHIDRVEGLPLMPSTRHLDTKDFSDFLEKAAQFLATKCGIVVLSSDMYFETPKKENK